MCLLPVERQDAQYRRYSRHTEDEGASMRLRNRLRAVRSWLPVPTDRSGIEPVRWILLEGHRLAVTVVLLVFVFLALLAVGRIWTLEMQQLLRETRTVENMLETIIAGILLLVPLVVSINAIALSHDMTSVETQEERINAVMIFRSKVARLTPPDPEMSDPATFLEGMALLMDRRADAVREAAEEVDPALAQETEEFVAELQEVIDAFESDEAGLGSGARFATLWRGIEFRYGRFVDQAIVLRDSSDYELTETYDERIEDLLEAFELFAIGKEYFKSLYYEEELSRLSRILLIVSLPVILLTATAILAMSANLIPAIAMFGLPQLQVFMAAVITMALIPYVLLTSYMLRLATVSIRTATGGPFWLD